MESGKKTGKSKKEVGKSCPFDIVLLSNICSFTAKNNFVLSSGKDSLSFDYLASIFSVDFMRSHNSGSCSKTPIKSRISSKCSLNLLAFSPLGATNKKAFQNFERLFCFHLTKPPLQQ
ncbi:MAG: hypothetical protein WBM13_10870 [Bacteroidia bacterium]